MPKHTPARLRLPRYGLTGAAATLLVVLVAWVAVRAAGPGQEDRGAPIMVLPSVPPVPAAAIQPSVAAIPIASASPSVSPSRSASSSPSASPSSSPSTSRSASPKPSAPRTTSKPPSRVPSPTPSRTVAPAFSAGYSAASSWDRGFIGMVQVTNVAGGARTWTVRVTYSSQARVYLRNVWNAQVSRQGSTFVFTGGPLAPGATAGFGFEASKRSRGGVSPTGCTVDGAPCRLS